MSDILEPDDDGSGHKIHENALSLSCICGWTSEATDDAYVDSIKLRHLRLNGVISDGDLDFMPYVNSRDFDSEYDGEDAPEGFTKRTEFTDDEEG